MSTAVAIYAALVGSGALGWQVFQWRHARSVRVTVTRQLAVLITQPPTHVLTTEAVNRSEFPLRVRQIGMDWQDDSGDAYMVFLPVLGSKLPGTVEPHDAAEGFMPRVRLEADGVDFSKPVRVWIRLADGTLVKSNPATLAS
jgi:hypothetical protein